MNPDKRRQLSNFDLHSRLLSNSTKLIGAGAISTDDDARVRRKIPPWSNNVRHAFPSEAAIARFP